MENSEHQTAAINELRRHEKAIQQAEQQDKLLRCRDLVMTPKEFVKSIVDDRRWYNEDIELISREDYAAELRNSLKLAFTLIEDLHDRLARLAISR